MTMASTENQAMYLSQLYCFDLKFDLILSVNVISDYNKCKPWTRSSTNVFLR